MRTSRNMLDSTEFRANRSAARAQTTCLHPNLRELSIGASSARMGTSSSEWRRRLWATRDVAATPLAVTHSGEDPQGLQEEQEVIRRRIANRLGAWLLHGSEGAFLHGQVCFDVDLDSRWALVPQPQSNDGWRNSRLQQVHGGACAVFRLLTPESWQRTPCLM
jgi:hypothetical protein